MGSPFVSQASVCHPENAFSLSAACFLGQDGTLSASVGDFPVIENPSPLELPSWFLSWEYDHAVFETLLALPFIIFSSQRFPLSNVISMNNFDFSLLLGSPQQKTVSHYFHFPAGPRRGPCVQHTPN